MITTDAWVLYKGSTLRESALETGDFRRERFSFSDISDDELFVEPLVGCWEANMSHALARSPIDICQQRGEDRIVLGNTGVVRVLRTGAQVSGIREGDIGGVFGASKVDKFGYMIEARAYDAPNTMGLLAKRSKIRAVDFMPLPAESPYSNQEWAAFMVRYVTAWANWKVAYGAYRLQVSEAEDPAPYVWGWGGGTTLAELDLARRQGCRVAMISGSDAHLETIRRLGIFAVDRRMFPNIAFDERRWAADAAYKGAYQESEERLLQVVMEHTEKMGAAIFLDYIGSPVLRATLKTLGREGVLSTAGWLLGMKSSTNRAIECIKRHIHVHTHYAKHADWFEATQFAVRTGWMPAVEEVHGWDDLGRLARSAAAGAVSYFPVYEINPI